MLAQPPENMFLSWFFAYLQLQTKLLLSSFYSSDITIPSELGKHLDERYVQNALKATGESLPIDNQRTFDPSTLSADNQKLLAAARYSSVAYCPENSIRQWACGSKCDYFTNTRVVSHFKTDVLGGSGFLAIEKSKTDGDVAILSFKGSESVSDWVSGLWHAGTDSTLSLNDESKRLYSGFHMAYLFIKSKAIKELTKLHDETKFSELIITGHGQGGALAVLAGLDILENLNPEYKVEVVTFGAPRIGDPAFANHVNKVFAEHRASLTRVINSNDLVPHLPLSPVFQHHSNEVWVNYETVQTCKDAEEDPKCSNSLKSYSILPHLYIWDVVFGPMCN
ncbi:Lipase, class 3 domain-containing protein [Rozella allomycis CSF55]|uniref:Lipase, class 3 domain-containing protein n=1 Tax=Rozella allomycis (strain CSF55) TaxID=988480 RepID=A0A075AZE9_ROZAC|nr:Lipase, class 3 domain-containing protein [Rozella allomycis CSF55]|eukprot:EPZ35680.1 Lipase, class 3 domain-containing protein [Rozella allomycis CSF55]